MAARGRGGGTDPGVARQGVSGPAPRHHRGRAASLSLIAVPAHYGLHAAPARHHHGLFAAGGVLAVAIAGLDRRRHRARHIFSPPVRQVVEYVEYLLMALVIPFAAWAIGLLTFVRYH